MQLQCWNHKHRQSLRMLLSLCIRLRVQPVSPWLLKVRLYSKSALDSFSATKWRQGPLQQPPPSWRCGLYKPRSCFLFCFPPFFEGPLKTTRLSGPRPPWLTSPAWRVVRPHLHRGSLGSAAKVNNECIFLLLRITSVLWWCRCVVSYVSFSVQPLVDNGFLGRLDLKLGSSGCFCFRFQHWE